MQKNKILSVCSTDTNPNDVGKEKSPLVAFKVKHSLIFREQISK